MAKTKNLCTFLIRFLAFGATLCAAIIMVTSHETRTLYGFKVEAKYSHTPAFKYFFIGNVVGSAYSLLALFIPLKSLLGRLVLLLDVIITMLLTSCISAALAIAYVGKKGNPSAGWLPTCGRVPNYCDHVTGALAAGIVGVFLYLVILVFHSHTVFSPLISKF